MAIANIAGRVTPPSTPTWLAWRSLLLAGNLTTTLTAVVVALPPTWLRIRYPNSNVTDLSPELKYPAGTLRVKRSYRASGTG